MLPIVILTFITVFLVISAIFMGFTAAKESSAAHLRRRLRRMAKGIMGESIPEDVRKQIFKETPPFEAFLSRIPFLRNLDKLLDHAGLKITPAPFLLITLSMAFSGFLIGFLVRRNYLLALLLSLILLVLPFLYVRYLKHKRLDKFTGQFPDALNMIGRSLRSGHALTGAIQLIGEEMPDPVGELFRTAYEQQKLGLRTTDAIANMAERMDSLDLRFFILTIAINTEVGGNLAEVLDKLADTIRERIKLRRQVRVYTAQGRMSGYILAVLPIVTFVIFLFIMPGYEDVLLKEKQGHYILAGTALLQIVGFFVIRKIINIRI